MTGVQNAYFVQPLVYVAMEHSRWVMREKSFRANLLTILLAVPWLIIYHERGIMDWDIFLPRSSELARIRTLTGARFSFPASK